MTKLELTQTIKTFAKEELGVDLIGITQALPDEQGKAYLSSFIEEGRNADMSYMANIELRSNPQLLLPGAKSVIVLGINYYHEQPPLPEGHGRIARYAYGRDYHKVIKKLLAKLTQFLEQKAPEAQFKPCVDSVPILEKSFAQKAGLGFNGKNTTLINPQIGSFFFLAELVTDLELEYDQPISESIGCGNCTRCIDACPTKALKGPGIMDAGLCISYLTIENRAEIPHELARKMGNLIFGCDICQEVCPYNQAFAKPLQLEPLKQVKIAGDSIPLQEILSIPDHTSFTARFAGSPLMRPGLAGLQRNARVVLGNQME